SGAALLAIRVVMGPMLAYHGWQKLDSVGKFVATVDRYGFPFPELLARATIAIELVGGICLALGLLTRLWGALATTQFLLIVVKVKWDVGLFGGGGRSGFELDLLYAATAAALLLAGPVAATITDGLSGLAQSSLDWGLVARATLTSIGLAVPAALLTLLLALPIVLAEAAARSGKRGRAAVLRGVLILPIAVSPMALGLGCFLILRLALDGTPRAILGIVLLNAIMVVPFAAAILRAAVERARARHDHLCRALGIAGWSRWRLIDWPILRPSIGTALAVAAAMALGDLIGIGLFGDAKIRNLTLLLYDQLGAYRMGGAAVTAALLMLLIFVLYQVIERGVGGRAAP
ncbi:MAG: DoxX family membrane protein, partial [Burkholderiales bacterium]